MCGIAGIFHFDREAPVDGRALAAMTGRLFHRGPDDHGSFIGEGVGLGARRLSIVDLAGGHQPHANEDGSIVSVCNGEIYNFPELRHQLEQHGHTFRSRCDVEVLVHLYEEHGAALAEQLNGQFAFAVFDRRKRELLLARDHVGIAPLFYTVIAGTLLFASEIKALLAYPGVIAEVNPEGLDQLLTFPGLVSPTTMFRGIHALPPGHILLARDGVVTTRQYWDLVYPEAGQHGGGDEREYALALEERLTDAVERRLMADVPVGFYLSGGLDSSFIGALVQKQRPSQRFHSFSIAFPQSQIDERPSQRLMAARLGTIHHETEFDRADIIDRLQAAVLHAETPLKESYNTCSLALSSLVRSSGLKVVLTGEGADELFAGYVGYRFDAARVRSAANDVETMLENELREELWGDAGFFYERDYASFRELKAGIYASDVAAALPSFESTRKPLIDLDKVRNRDPLHRRSYIDFKLRLADHLLADHGDRIAYASSIEARYPFLDRGVIDLARTIPPSLLIRNDTEKYLLREAARPHLPPEILSREKFGFVAPASPYLLSRHVDWIEDLLSPATIRRQGWFDPATVERLKSRAAKAEINTTFETDLLMIVLTFGIFYETFVQQATSAQPLTNCRDDLTVLSP
ncbi:MAG: asparagine synthase (glutamine-hydrolyzing) [Thermoanaerobaculia bacterium]